MEQADHQLGSSISTACLSEGQGYLVLTKAKPDEAVKAFRQAVAGWETVERLYAQMRALSGLGQALTQFGETEEAKRVFDQALGVVHSLAAQLDDPELKASFLNSALVTDIQTGRSTLSHFILRH